MRMMFLCLIAALCLMGCPKGQVNKIASVRVVATCNTPGAPCTFEHFTDYDDSMFNKFEVRSNAMRAGKDDVAEDEVIVEFRSKVPVMGYMAGMNNDVFGDSQTLEVVHKEGDGNVDSAYAWKMKIALDDKNQYELTMDFYGPPIQ
ncbi:MAG: hypothetical protein HUU46_18530 [Candidatus Hydrogenedentes bacterium]|nr:hypothetical protein [Candidatus Hydrogenedentota bacterium]